MKRPDRGIWLILLALLAALPAQAQDSAACPAALQDVQRTAGLPPRLLETLAMVESGRNQGGRVIPWPWTINVDGTGHFYDSKAEAIAAVQAFQAGGARSIDVGCMQINLRMHPHAFASLDDAFEPGVNTRYGAQFLLNLYAASRSWAVAMTAYHSSTPALASDYARKILAVWPQAAALGLVVTEPTLADGPASGHDYTEAFARQVAADMAARRARNAVLTNAVLAQAPRAAQPARVLSLLRVASAEARHGPAWPAGVP